MSDGYQPTANLRYSRTHVIGGVRPQEVKVLEQLWQSIYEGEEPQWRQIPIVDIEE